jgi:hypothetical protein
MPEVDQLELRARIGRILNRWPTVGLALGVVRNGRLEFFHGHGFADIASNTPVIEDTVFRIGSITKTFTAIAVMQLFEQGLVDLDASYLRLQVVLVKRLARDRATSATHTVLPGLPVGAQADFGESVKAGDRAAGEYRGGLRIAASGTSSGYNPRPATLGRCRGHQRRAAHRLRRHLRAPA